VPDDFPHKVTMVVVVNGFVVAVISGDGLVVLGVVIAAGVTIIFVFTGVIAIVLVSGLCCCFRFFLLLLFSRGSRSSFKCGILVRYAQALIVGVE